MSAVSVLETDLGKGQKGPTGAHFPLLGKLFYLLLKKYIYTYMKFPIFFGQFLVLKFLDNKMLNPLQLPVLTVIFRNPRVCKVYYFCVPAIRNKIICEVFAENERL